MTLATAIGSGGARTCVFGSAVPSATDWATIFEPGSYYETTRIILLRRLKISTQRLVHSHPAGWEEMMFPGRRDMFDAFPPLPSSVAIKPGWSRSRCEWWIALTIHGVMSILAGGARPDRRHHARALACCCRSCSFFILESKRLNRYGPYSL